MANIIVPRNWQSSVLEKGILTSTQCTQGTNTDSTKAPPARLIFSKREPNSEIFSIGLHQKITNTHKFGRGIRNIMKVWPTIAADVVAFIPVMVLWSFFIFDYDKNFHVRVWNNVFLPWEEHKYVAEVLQDTMSAVLFAFWTFTMFVTSYIVYYHLVVAHHPKFYASRMNRIALVGHIIGGKVANLGSFVGFITNSITLIKISSIFGILLHFPSSLWQARNVYGCRETMQPLYYFFIYMTFFKYTDVWFDRGSPASVMAMGFALNIFALVRLNHLFLLSLNTNVIQAYDRAVMFAGITSLPVCLGPTGCIQLIPSVFLWNLLIEAWMPDLRELLQIERSYNDVFQNTFNGRPVNFAQELRKYKKLYKGDDREAVARCAFHIMAGERDYINLEDLVELYDGWGLPWSDMIAMELFGDVDKNNDGVIDYEDFKDEMWFVWERIYNVGECDVGKDGKHEVNLHSDPRFNRRSTARSSNVFYQAEKYHKPKRPSVFGSGYTKERRESLWGKRRSRSSTVRDPATSARFTLGTLKETQHQKTMRKLGSFIEKERAKDD